MTMSGKRRRPKGIWKAQGRDGAHDSTSVFHDSDDDLDSLSLSSPQNQYRFSHSDTSSEADDEVYYYYLPELLLAPPPPPPPSPRPRSRTRTRIMDISPVAASVNATTTCTLDDWEDLKDLFGDAATKYESDTASEALPVLRAVVHECHRFLKCYPDPSVLFEVQTPSQTPAVPASSRSAKRKSPSTELCTAFHALLGTALFLFGNLIAQDASLALPGEPNSPSSYWLAALDVFETGENLPCRTNGDGACDGPEDWRMAVVWGRTLICIADETLSRHAKELDNNNEAAQAHRVPVASFVDDEPNYPPESPFAVIKARRPPILRHTSLASATPNDLMILAMDQFSRGIFHMPHPQHGTQRPLPTSSSSDPPTTQSTSASRPPEFSRAKELFTIASEVLLIAEKMDEAEERQCWAAWADSVFSQMKMEADMDAWRTPITRARGRCWLIVGSARVDELEAGLERGDPGILDSEDAIDAREGLTKAVEFLERAKLSASAISDEDMDGDGRDPERHELGPLLAEALLTLANLTTDEVERERLYARAQAHGGIVLDDDTMDESP